MNKNQCDGCKLGLPVKDGIHYFKSGKIYMSCEKDKYVDGKFGYSSFGGDTSKVAKI